MTATETATEKAETQPATEENQQKAEETEKKEEAAAPAEPEVKMTGRVIIVTGANSGIGFELSKYLCEGGNDVILACRNEEKANAAITKIKNANPNALATFMQLDLGSFESIRKFVDDFHESGKKLHVLVNNAGLACNFKDTKRQYTKDNLELTIGTNHLGHFLLTNLLLEDLKQAGSDGGDARIVVVSSSIHDPETMKRRGRQYRSLQPLDLEDLLMTKDGAYSGLQAYKNSKAANIMFTYELAKRLDGTGVTVNTVCPGFIPSTELVRNAPAAQKVFLRYILHGMLRFMKTTRTVQQGAQAVADLVTNEKFKEITGKYFKDGNEVESAAETKEEEKLQKLWELSGGYVRLEGYEPIEIPEPPPEEEKPAKGKKKEEKKDGETSKEAEKAEGEGEKKEEEKKEEEKKEEEVIVKTEEPVTPEKPPKEEEKPAEEESKPEETKEETKKKKVPTATLR